MAPGQTQIVAMKLTERLREGTKSLHTQTERAGIMPILLSGRLPLNGYCALLRNFHRLYGALELGLTENATHFAIAPIYDPRLFRVVALAADLSHLCGPNWSMLCTVATTTERYARRLADLSAHAPELLVAHAYVRYLGDLSGGQILKRIVRKSYGLTSVLGTDFYEFGTGADVAADAARLREGLDAIKLPDSMARAIVEESQLAFELHGELFDELGALEDNAQS